MDAVERSEDPGPRRERATVLTDEAVVLTSEARAAVAEVVATMTGPLQRGDLEQLRALLAACRDALA